VIYTLLPFSNRTDLVKLEVKRRAGQLLPLRWRTKPRLILELGKELPSCAPGATFTIATSECGAHRVAKLCHRPADSAGSS